MEAVAVDDAWTDDRDGEAGGGGTQGAGESPERLDALVGSPPTTRRRGRLRRRLRHLRRVREVLMRDLGGFVFELHRSGGDGGNPVVEAKLERLAAVDAELRELEDILADHRPLVVREPGIGGACPTCGELYGSQARYCWACGSEVAAGAGRVPEMLVAYAGAPAVGPGDEPAAIEATAEEDAPGVDEASADPGTTTGTETPADPDAPTEVHRP